MAAACDLNAAKKNLQESLGENMKVYLQNLKSWFKQKISKEDFDLEARSLLTDDAVHLHNEFLLAIIARCQTLSSSLVPKESSLLGKGSSDSSKQTKPLRQKLRKRPPSSRNTFQQRFVPANPVVHLPEVNFKGADDIVFAARELSLPDISMVHGRMLVCAWESGLEDVSDMAVRLVMQSIENQLKNLISVVLSQRSGYKLREKKFKFAVGTQVKNPYLRHANLIEDENTESEATMISQTGNHIPSRKSPLEMGEGLAAEQLAAANQPMYKGPVSLFDLAQCLQLYKSAIPSHTVYSVAVERVIHRLWHPSHEEINQDIIHTQEVALKQQMATPTLSGIQATGGHYPSKHHHGKHHHHHHHRDHHHHHHHHRSEHHSGHHKVSESTGHQTEQVKSENIKSEHLKSEHHKSELLSQQAEEPRSSGIYQKFENPSTVQIKSEHLSPVHVKSEHSGQLRTDQHSGSSLKSEPPTVQGQLLAQQITGGFTSLKSEQSSLHSVGSRTETPAGQHKNSHSLQQSGPHQAGGQLMVPDDSMDFLDDNLLDQQMTSHFSGGHSLTRQTSLDQSLAEFFAVKFPDNT